MSEDVLVSAKYPWRIEKVPEEVMERLTPFLEPICLVCVPVEEDKDESTIPRY